MFAKPFLLGIGDYVKTFESFPFPTILCDIEFQVYWSNASAKEAYPLLTQTGPLREVFSRYDLTELVQRVEHSGGLLLSDMLPLNTAQFSISPLFYEGEYIGFTLVVTQPRENSTLARLDQLSTASSVFSNEIRSTVGDIFASMDSIAQKAELLNADWIKPHLTGIALDSYQILRLSSNITKFARFRNHESALELTSYNIFSWLRRIQEPTIALSEDMGVPITFDIPEGDAYLTLDSRKFESAFFNVLHNALYYTKEGNHITITARADADEVELVIQDKGIGIPKLVLPNVFEPYYYFAPDGFPPSLGLGLTIARMVFDAHGGSMKVDSQWGGGTIATIRLPFPSFSAPLFLEQGDQSYSLQDRFSPMYVGIASAKTSPYREIP